MKSWAIVDAGQIVEILDPYHVETLEDAARETGRGYVQLCEVTETLRQDGFGRLACNLGQPRIVADRTYTAVGQPVRVWNGKVTRR